MHAVHDEADHAAVHLDDHDAVVLAARLGRQFEPLAEVDHRDNLAAKVDDTLDLGRALGHAGEVHHAVDFLHPQDVDGALLAADLERDELQLIARGPLVRGRRALHG